MSYSSSNKKVARVSKKGVVTLLKRGKATVKVKYLGKTYKVRVVCRPSLIGKVFRPNLSNVASLSFEEWMTRISILVRNKK